jgi:hypothetical protein
MSVTVIVSLKVAEFSKWKAGFDLHAVCLFTDDL